MHLPHPHRPTPANPARPAGRRPPRRARRRRVAGGGRAGRRRRHRRRHRDRGRGQHRQVRPRQRQQPPGRRVAAGWASCGSSTSWGSWPGPRVLPDQPARGALHRPASSPIARLVVRARRRQRPPDHARLAARPLRGRQRRRLRTSVPRAPACRPRSTSPGAATSGTSRTTHAPSRASTSARTTCPTTADDRRRQRQHPHGRRRSSPARTSRRPPRPERVRHAEDARATGRRRLRPRHQRAHVRRHGRGPDGADRILGARARGLLRRPHEPDTRQRRARRRATTARPASGDELVTSAA